MSSKLIIVLTTCFLVLGVRMSYAENTTNNTTQQEQEKQQKHDEFSKELNLTQEQKDKIKTFRDSTKDKLKQLTEELKTKRQELKEEIEKADMSNAKITNIATSIKTLYGQILDIRISNATFLKEILTPEQFSKMQKKIHEHKDKIRNKMQHNKENKDNKDSK